MGRQISSRPSKSFLFFTSSGSAEPVKHKVEGAGPPLSPDANQILSSNSTCFVSILIEWRKMARRRLSNNDSNIKKNINPIIVLLF